MITEGRDLRVSALTFLIMKIKSRADIIRYLEENDPSYRIEGNVVFAPKAFIINTVIQWCYNQLKIKKIQPNEMDFYLMSIESFLQGKANLSWEVTSGT